MNPPGLPRTQVNCNHNCNHGAVPDEAAGSTKRLLPGPDTCPGLAAGLWAVHTSGPSRTASHTLHRGPGKAREAVSTGITAVLLSASGVSLILRDRARGSCGGGILARLHARRRWPALDRKST